MMDMTATVAPKSDQMNADDLIGRTRTIKLTRVSISAGDDQPVSIFYEGDEGKPFKPCKSMRRVLINAWGGDANLYAGRRMTLHRDDKVAFGGMAVGGIRISHVSDITRDVTMALTDKRGSRKPYVVKPLPKEEASANGQEQVGEEEIARLMASGETEAARGMEALGAFWGGLSPAAKKAVGGAPQISKWKVEATAVDARSSIDWRAELDTYAGDLGDCGDDRALKEVVERDGARFVDAPPEVQAEARNLEEAERARVAGSAK